MATNNELVEKYKDFIKSVYFYPDGMLKVWFKNDKQIIFNSVAHLEEYIKEHEKELLCQK